MRFRHAFTITTDNFVETLKLLLYRLVTTLIFGSIAYVILKLGLAAVTESAEVSALKDVVGGFFNAIVSGNTDVLAAFQGDFASALSDVLKLIASHSASIIGCAVGLVVLWLVTRFVNGLAVFALGGTLSDRMSAYARTKFSQSYFRNLGRAALYQIIYVPLSFVYDTLSLLACWFFFFYAPSFLPSWGAATVVVAVSLAILGMILLISLKMTLVSAWIPAVVTGGKRVGKAFSESVANGKDFGGRFVGFVAGIYFILIANACAAVFTVGSALLVTVPASYVFLLAMQLVNYFRSENRRYFVSRRRIVGEEESGFESEQQPPTETKE